MSAEATGTGRGGVLADLAAEFRAVLRAHATSFPGPVVDALLPIVAARLADERERIARDDANLRRRLFVALTEQRVIDSQKYGEAPYAPISLEDVDRELARIAREGGQPR